MKIYVIFFLLLAQLVYSDSVPKDVAHAIEKALQGKGEFKNYFTKNKKNWGFDPHTTLSDVVPGEPFQVYTIAQETFEQSSQHGSVSSLITHSNRWYVPLYLNDTLLQSQLFIIRSRIEDRWETGMRSDKQLVQTWQQIKKVWPEKDGYHPKLVLIDHSLPWFSSLCLYIPEMGDSNLTFLGTYIQNFSPSTDTIGTELTSSNQLIQSLKDQQKKYEQKTDSLWKEQQRINDSLVKKREIETEPLWKALEIEYSRSVINQNVSDTSSIVTAWWAQTIVQADTTIIPATFTKKSSTSFRSDSNAMNDLSKSSKLRIDTKNEKLILTKQIIKSAVPLRIDTRPYDQVLTCKQDHWYVLYAKDGTGFIRIGTTGPLLIDGAPYKNGRNWGPGGFFSSYEGPQKGADLQEISLISITQQALIWRVKNAFLRIRTESKNPVSYRIIFVSNLPVNRTGNKYGPGVAANSYIFAIIAGNTTDLYQTTRIQHTKKQLLDLRMKLFGTNKRIDRISTHKRPDALEPNAEGRLHVQHIILSSIDSHSKRKNWAFRCICIQQGGLWLVTSVIRDPELSDDTVKEIVERDIQRFTQVP